MTETERPLASATPTPTAIILAAPAHRECREAVAIASAGVGSPMRSFRPRAAIISGPVRRTVQRV
jgi:hypothetical protein